MAKKIKKRDESKVVKDLKHVSVGELPFLAVKLFRLGFNDLHVKARGDGTAVLVAEKRLYLKDLLGDLIEVGEPI